MNSYWVKRHNLLLISHIWCQLLHQYYHHTHDGVIFENLTIFLKGSSISVHKFKKKKKKNLLLFYYIIKLILKNNFNILLTTIL